MVGHGRGDDLPQPALHQVPSGDAVIDGCGVDVDVVRYLDTPPDAATLRSILAALDGTIRADLYAASGGPSWASPLTTWPPPTASSTSSSPTRS